MSDKPSRRQIVFNWIMAEDLSDHDAYWTGGDGVNAVDELLAALDGAAEAALAEAKDEILRLEGIISAPDVTTMRLREQLRLANEENARLREALKPSMHDPTELASAQELIRQQRFLVSQLQTTISQLDSLLNQISEISDQPFTETHEHLPDWIKTILQTRIDYAKREWDEAQKELTAIHAQEKTL